MPSKEVVIKAALDAEKRLKSFWLTRTEMMGVDRKLRDLDPMESILKDKKITPKVQKVIDNHPQAYWDWAVASLANKQFEWVVPMTNVLSDDNKRSKLERLTYGVDAQIDEILLRRGLEPWRFMLAEQIVSGWYAIFPDVIEVGTERFFTIEFWDPITVFQEFDSIGLSAVVRSYKTTLGDALTHVKAQGETSPDMFDGDLEQAVSVVDHWWRPPGKRVMNSFVIEGKLALDEREEAEYMQHIPILTGAVTGRSGETGSGMTNTHRANWGRSILAPNRDLIRQNNTWFTLLRERARNITFPHYIDTTQDAQGLVEEGDLDAGESRVFHARQGEDLREIQRSSIPFDVRLEAERQSVAIQRGSIPDALFGSNQPSFASGFLEVDLAHKATLRLGRAGATYRRVGESAMMQIVRKLKKIGGTVKLTGHNLRKNALDGFIHEEFDSEADIPDQFYITMKHRLDTPIDRSAIVDQETRLAQAGIHSKRRAMEETSVEDPVAETLQILDESAAMQMLEGSAILAMNLEEKAGRLDEAGEFSQARAFRAQADMVRQQAAIQASQAQAGQNQPQQRNQGSDQRVLPNDQTGGNQDLFPRGGRRPPPRGPVMARPGNQNARNGGG